MFEITCPSGLRGRARKMTVKDAREFTGTQSKDSLGRLLAACWLETLDPGPYSVGSSGIDWSEVLTSDRLAAFIGLRKATHGSEYAFKVNCASCKRKIEWELDLGDLPVRPLTEEARKTFEAGGHFETHLPDADNKVAFHMLVGRDEERLARLRKRDEELDTFDLIASRLCEVEGVAPEKFGGFVDSLTMSDIDHLLDAFDSVDSGIDSAIEIRCPKCRSVQEIELPFGETFLLPGKGRSARRRRTSSDR